MIPYLFAIMTSLTADKAHFAPGPFVPDDWETKCLVPGNRPDK